MNKVMGSILQKKLHLIHAEALSTHHPEHYKDDNVYNHDGGNSAVTLRLYDRLVE